MQNEIHNSTKPSSSSPAPRQRPRRPQRRRKPQGRNRNAAPPAVHSVSCGGIVFRRRNGIIEIFFIKDPYQRWTFPKGKQEAGENYVETAVREIREETGLDSLTYVAPLGKTSFRFRRDVGVIQKTVYYFLFQAPPDAQAHFAAKEELQEGKEPIFEGRWVPMSKAFSVSSYKNSDHLIAQAFRIIASMGAKG